MMKKMGHLLVQTQKDLRDCYQAATDTPALIALVEVAVVHVPLPCQPCSSKACTVEAALLV